MATAIILAAAILPGAAADRIRLRAEAGLGGAARQGRWTPVRIQVDSTDLDLTGDVVVEWGDARVHRAIDVPAASRTVFELYVRSTDVRGALSVRVVAKDETLASVEVPLRILADDEALVLCAGAGLPTADAAPCTATMPPEALPRSLRGYVAASEVRLPPGAEARLSPPQRAALRRWRAYRELEAHDLLGQAPRAPLTAFTPAGAGRPAAVAAGSAMALLMCSAWIWIRGRTSAPRAYLAVAGATVLGVLAAATAGRAGPGAEIRVRYSMTLEQVADGALVSMRGTIEYPAFGDYTIGMMGLDGDLAPRRADAARLWFDASGAPIRRGTFGRGVREEIDADGIVDYAPFQVHVEGNVIRVRNGSDTPLTDCSFPEGYSERRAGALAPGTSASAQAFSASDLPFFSCVLARPPVTFADSRFPVRAEGAAVVSVRLPDPFRGAVIE